MIQLNPFNQSDPADTLIRVHLGTYIVTEN
ncbi:MAG: hypothetical protein ACI9EW_003486 [Cellvibrionaceae bacterium]|jgi:hypothetical protein